MPYRSVFISHAHADNEKCDPYDETLRKRGISLYYDRANPQIGHSLDTALERQIERAKALIVMVTPAALTSFWVGREISMFFTLMSKDPTRLLIPVKLEPCELPTRLESLWWIDATTLRFEEVVEQLVGALHVVEPPTASPSVSATTSRPASDSPLHVDTPPQVPRYATVRPVPVTPDSASKAVERMPATPDADDPLPTGLHVPFPTPVQPAPESQRRLRPPSSEPKSPQQAQVLPDQPEGTLTASSRRGISRRALLVGTAGTVALCATCATSVYGGVTWLTRTLGYTNDSLLWKAEINGPGTAPVVANGMVYMWSEDVAIRDGVVIGDGSGSINAFDASTGTKRWTYSSGSSFAVANGVLYGGSLSNAVYALNAGTSAWLWSSLVDLDVSSVTTTNGLVYVGSSSNSVFAFDASTGTKRWSTRLHDIDSAPQSSLAVASGQVLYNSSNGILYALGADDGSKRWEFQVSTLKNISLDSSPSSLAVADGLIYVSSKDGGLYALDAGTGKTRWHVLANDFLTSPTVANGVIYIRSSYNDSSPESVGSLYALDATTGTKRWNHVANAIGSDNSPAVANGVVYVSSADGLYAFDASTGAKRWSTSPSNLSNLVSFLSNSVPSLSNLVSSPTVANGRVYVVGDALYALNA